MTEGVRTWVRSGPLSKLPQVIGRVDSRSPSSRRPRAALPGQQRPPTPTIRLPRAFNSSGSN